MLLSCIFLACLWVNVCVCFYGFLQEDPREVEASKYDLNYIGLEGNIGCMGKHSIVLSTSVVIVSGALSAPSARVFFFVNMLFMCTYIWVVPLQLLGAITVAA